MEMFEKLKGMQKDKKMLAAVTGLGMVGLLLIMISSFLPDKKEERLSEIPQVSSETYDSYCSDTEKRLENFLRSVDGAGDVKVYLTVGSNERYIYATEGKNSRSDDKTEVEEKYVIVGSGSDKSALIETVETPEIRGAVIACTGCGDPSVEERIYKAAAAALGLPTSKIYVTKLK